MNTSDNVAIFCAALQGFVANKDFNGSVSQGSAQVAVEFARSVVRESHNNNPDSMTPKIV